MKTWSPPRRDGVALPVGQEAARGVAGIVVTAQAPQVELGTGDRLSGVPRWC